MSTTNGFLALSQQEFGVLKADAEAFERRARARDESAGYLDMDKAGEELFMLLTPMMAGEPERPYQHIAALLAGGDEIFPDLDLGNGPANVVERSKLEQAMADFNNLEFETIYALTDDELFVEIIGIDPSEDEFREYHWTYLQSLHKFVRDAIDHDLVVLRY